MDDAAPGPPGGGAGERGGERGSWVGHGAAVDLAKDSLKSGAFDTAKQILRSVISQDPTHFDALFNLAHVFDVCHEFDEFEDYITKAVKAKPEHAQAWIYKAMCEERRGDFEANLACLARAQDLDPAGPVGQDAAQQIEMNRRNLGCPLLHRPCLDESAPRITAQQPRQQPVSLDSSSLVPPRSFLRGEHCVRVVDNMFGPKLLTCLHECVDDIGQYLHRNPRHCRTFWLAREMRPRTAAELAGRLLLEKVLACRIEDFVGIEWWCKNQTANLGAHFHYDMAVADGAYWRPTYSSVLYLSDHGGPTVISDQAADLHHPQWPEIPQEGYLVMPRFNRWTIFPGELRHGCMPVDDDRTHRYVILYNFWTSHRPSGPNCQEPDLSHYLPISARAPTAKYLLPEDQLNDLTRSEEARLIPHMSPGGEDAAGAGGLPRPVPVETLASPADFEDSSTFGELPLAMPMPSLGFLRQQQAPVFHIMWGQLASEYLCRVGSRSHLDGSYIPRLSERLPLWEIRDEGQKLQRRVADILAWHGSAFTTKAKELAQAEVVKALERESDDCKLGLGSLTTYIRNDLKHELSISELNGAYFARNMPRVEAQPCNIETLHDALFDVIEADLHSAGFCVVECGRVPDSHHGLIMSCTGIRPLAG